MLPVHSEESFVIIETIIRTCPFIYRYYRLRLVAISQP